MTNRKRSVWVWIAYLFLAVTLYVASMGPVWAATSAWTIRHPEHRWIGNVYRVIYSPIIAVMKRSPAITAAFESYGQFCRDFIL